MLGSYFIGMLYILLNSTTFSKVLGQSQSLEYFLSVPPCVFPQDCMLLKLLLLPLSFPCFIILDGRPPGFAAQVTHNQREERWTHSLLFLFKWMVQCSKASASEDPAALVSHHRLPTSQTALQSPWNRLFSFWVPSRKDLCAYLYYSFISGW